MTKQAPTITDLPPRLPGENDKAYWRRVVRELFGESIRSKVDLREWTGSPEFHLDKPDHHK